MILIYTPQLTSRILYTFDLIFNEILCIEYSLTDDKEKLISYPGQKFIYGNEPIDNIMIFYAHPLLFQNNIVAQKVEKIDWDDCVGLFETTRTSNINFDLFASTFYLVTRYEEYLPHHIDRYQRFGSSVSIAYIFQFLRKPMVNYYCRQLLKMLEAKFGKLDAKSRKFELVLTYDIDNAYEYRGRGIVSHFLSLGKYLLTARFKKFFERIAVVFFGKKDPYDQFMKMDRWHKKFNLYPIYFFLLAVKKSQYDTNLKYNNSLLKRLISNSAANYEIGLHPSYYSSASFNAMETELNLLKKYSDKDIFRSRQHFLKISLPETYNNLIKLNILNDYTMGYSSRPGYRASICQPFYWYDLRTETKTNLRIHPFAFMDATFKYYKMYRSEKIRERLLELYHEAKQFNGTFITVFHNDILAEERYSKLYEGFLSEVC